jgi:branched-subunit amino acid transport protein
MVDMTSYWPVALGIGAGTLLIRYSFILIMDKVTLPDLVHRMLRFIPASVLPALIFPAVFLHQSGDAVAWAGMERTAAWLAAVLIAWKTRNILATIAAGMAVLWLLKALA